jgi:hypothetical protein
MPRHSLNLQLFVYQTSGLSSPGQKKVIIGEARIQLQATLQWILALAWLPGRRRKEVSPGFDIFFD